MPVLAIGAGIAAVGGVAQGLIGANAANNAANLQYQASQNALNFQKGVFNWQQGLFNNAQTNLNPFIQAGQGATSTLSQLTGGGTNTPNYSAFYNSPDYQFAQTQGMKGLTNYENAQGMGLSGGALRDVSTFNQGLATQQYGNYFNRLMQIATLGGNAAGSGASLAGGGMSAGNGASSTIGNTTMAGGQAQASGVVGAANAITGGIGSGINNSLFAAALGSNPSAYKSAGMNSLLGGGASGGGGGTGFSLTGTGGLY